MSKSVLQLRFRVRMRPDDYTNWLIQAVEPAAGEAQPRWQAWSVDPYTRESSGIYIFDTADELRAFMKGQMMRELKDNPGIVGLNATVYRGLPRKPHLPEQREPLFINARPNEAIDYVQAYLRLC